MVMLTYYGEDKPEDAINEMNGKSADINKSFDGEYVWLVPGRAATPRMMADKLWTDIRSDADCSLTSTDDLAKGTGGDYRYFSWCNDMNANHFVTDVAFWRTDDSQGSPPDGWHCMSGDINKGRDGDYLYLVWRTKQYCGPKDF